MDTVILIVMLLLRFAIAIYFVSCSGRVMLNRAALLCAGMGVLAGIAGFSGPLSRDFDLSKHSVPLEQILPGGPGKDGIPALLSPRFIRAFDATFLTDSDRVLGLELAGDSKAYPVKILNWHEIVNDTVGGKQVVITYCPLCGSGIAFDARVEGTPHTFGVSGLLYQSDLLMYDHQSESLWSQIAMEAVAGPLTGTRLTPLFLEHTTWADWKANHPTTHVLSTRTGHVRDYNRDPYLGYTERADLMFPTRHTDRRYHPKEWVLGVEVDGTYKAYPFSELRKLSRPLLDEIKGRTIRIDFKATPNSATATQLDGKPVPAFAAFWFAWSAFHPDTVVYKAEEAGPRQ